MKKTVVWIMVLALAVSLCGCAAAGGGEYDDLIAAIEDDDYDEALRQLQELMDVTEPANTQDPVEDENATLPSTGPAPCAHLGAAATCTADSVCNACGELLEKALGHDYQEGICTRCGEADPADAARLKVYNNVMAWIDSYERMGSCNTADMGYLTGNAALEYIYNKLLELGNYRDCPEYLSRFSIVPDQLLYFDLVRTDNLGNLVSRTTIDYEYDALGRVTMSEHIDYNDPFGVYLQEFSCCVYDGSYAHGGSQYHAVYEYDDQGRITQIQWYYVSLRSILTPEYDENGRIQSMHFRMNTVSGTLMYEYDAIGQLTGIQGPDYQLAYSYNPDGTLASRTISGKSNYTTVYTYDAAGNRTGWTRDADSCVITYDDQGRILQENITTREGTSVHDYHYGDFYIYQPAEES